MNDDQSIAILLFSRSARQDAEEKRWLASQDRATNESLAKAMELRTRKVLHDAGLPVIHINESKQVGQSFGERLAHAFNTVFDEGYQSVICVGNDCPNIDQIDFSEVAGILTSGRSVIGPDYRNGAYLIALNKEDFHRPVFAQLSWQTSDLYDDLVSFLDNPETLTRRRDFNDSRDLYLHKREVAWLARLLRQLITFEFSYHPGGPGWGHSPDSDFGRRGPPSF